MVAVQVLITYLLPAVVAAVAVLVELHNLAGQAEELII
jgi:hypothetical protein